METYKNVGVLRERNRRTFCCKTIVLYTSYLLKYLNIYKSTEIPFRYVPWDIFMSNSFCLENGATKHNSKLGLYITCLTYK